MLKTNNIVFLISKTFTIVLINVLRYIERGRCLRGPLSSDVVKPEIDLNSLINLRFCTIFSNASRKHIEHLLINKHTKYIHG